nr:unnamed protein product [Callosobruchus chinensis]
MATNTDETDFLENWAQVITETDVQYNKAISSIKQLISFDTTISNDVADIECDVDDCVAAYHKKMELSTTKQKLQQEQNKLSQDIENYNRKIKYKCLQASTKHKTYKNLLKTAVKKYESNFDFVITIENKTDTLYEATFKFKPRKEKVLKVLIDRTKAEIVDCTILHDLPNDVDTKDIPNLLYLLHKSRTKK